jgi:pyruvate formate lyase activating enzyme
MAASGGGITASGGEAVLQAEFVGELFAACKAQGIHTCLDTNGFVRHYDAILDTLLANTDLVLLDIKHIDDAQHIPLTHVSNKYSLDFAKHLATLGKKMWIRHVVVPTWNDDDASTLRLGEFIQSLGDCVEKVELLPYHELGKHKWVAFGDNYELGHLSPPSAEKMQHLRQLLSTYHPHVIC